MRLLARGEASSLYGAIVMSLILAIFASLYSAAVASLARQGEIYREAFRGYLEAYSERLDLYWNSSSSSIYAYTETGARVVYVVASNGSSIIMAMGSSIKLDPGSRVEVLPKDLSRYVVSSKGFLAVFTETGRVYTYRPGLGGGAGSIYAVQGAVRGVYYAVNVGQASYVAYYYQNGVRMNITTYRWDIDKDYIIFQSPIDGDIYLERSSSGLGVLNTSSWFNPPEAFYQKPRVSISFPPPWSAMRAHDLYLVLMDVASHTYDPALGVKVTRQVTIAPSGAVGSVVLWNTYLSWGATYTAIFTVSDMPSDWSVTVTTNRLLPGDLGVVGWDRLECYSIDIIYRYYRAAWIAQVAIYSSTSTSFSISLGVQTLYIPTDRECNLYFYVPRPSQPTHTWLYGLTAYGLAKTYTNSSLYAKQGDLVIASNGNKIRFIDNISLLPTF